MKKLIQGIIDFRQRVRPGYQEIFAQLALGQAPDALLIACSDSRVAPNLFASTEPGDLFVIRNIGNLIPPFEAVADDSIVDSEAAALEFSTLALEIKDIIVCGHSECGAMHAALHQTALESAPHVHSWLCHTQAALDRLNRGERMPHELSLHNHLSQLNVLEQLKHLRSYPFIREREVQGALRLHAWWFDIAEAEVRAFEETQKAFVIIDEDEAARILDRLGD